MRISAPKNHGRRQKALIVGSGPAGLAAAEVLSEAEVDVVVAEAMPSAGRKFLMAGKSGLNLTKNESSLPSFFQNETGILILKH